MMNPRLKRALIVMLIVTAVLILGLSVDSLRGQQDKTLDVVQTAMKLTPKLKPTSIKFGELLDSFPDDLKLSTEEHQIAHYPVLTQFKNRVTFDNGLLEYTPDLRNYLDELLMLYPSLSFEQLRYLVALELVKLDKTFSVQRYMMFEDVFIKYVNYSQAEESLEINEENGEELSDRFEAVKRLRREHLSERITRVFFQQEEQYFESEILLGEPEKMD
ncbi:MAG: lipase secretion chaperone [Pseudomonadota bacterium]